MNIPNVINILGRRYKVIFHEEEKSGNNHLGTHWGAYTTIYLNKIQDRQSMESSLIHEIIEAINFQA